MTINIIDVSTFSDPLLSPADGDLGDQALFLLVTQRLANRTRFLFDNIGGLPNIAANTILGRASTGPVEGKTASDFTISTLAQADSVAWSDTLGLKGADIPSAGVTNLAGADGTYVHVTGSTTITSFGTAAAGARRWVRFSGALTLTHSASLILPGAVNITTVGDDMILAVSEGAGVWRVASYLGPGADVASVTAAAGQNIIQISPTMGAVVVTPLNQEIDTVTFNTLYGLNAGNVGSHTGARNTAFGEDALAALVGGTDNTVFGYKALETSDEAQANVFVGAFAGQFIAGVAEDVPSSNVAVGYEALQGIIGTDGVSGNVAVGYRALKSVANAGVGTIQNNTAVGILAGTGITTGQHNTLIGAAAGGTITTGSTNIIIGRSLNPPSPTDSNHLNIGGVIFADLSSGGVRIGSSGLVDKDGLTIQHPTAAHFYMIEDDGGTDETTWRTRIDGGTWKLQARDTDDLGGSSALQFTRTGSTVDLMQVFANADMQENDIVNAANIDTGQLTIQSATQALFSLVDDNEAADEKRWQWATVSGSLFLRTRTDADGTGVNAIWFDRGTGTAVAQVNVGADLDLNSNNIIGIATLAIDNTTTGDAIRIEDSGSPVQVINGDGEVAFTPTSGQPFLVTTLGAGNIAMIAAGTGDAQLLSVGGSAVIQGATKIALHSNLIQIRDTETAPIIEQALSTTAAGQPMIFRAQGTSFAASDGGSMSVIGGLGTDNGGDAFLLGGDGVISPGGDAVVRAGGGAGGDGAAVLSSNDSSALIFVDAAGDIETSHTAAGSTRFKDSGGTVRQEIDDTGIAWFTASPVAQAADPGALTDSTTGTANSTVVDVGASFNQGILNDNFADLIAKVNALRGILSATAGGNGLAA